MNLNDNPRGGTFCLSSAGLAVGGTDTIARTNAPNGAGIDFAIDSKLYHLADADDNIALTGIAITSLYVSLALVLISTAGALTVVQSNEVLITEFNAGAAVLKWPKPTVNTCPIGAIKIACDSALFTGGTTSLGTANTATYYNLFTVPAAPMTVNND